jgi:hypothetical protein
MNAVTWAVICAGLLVLFVEVSWLLGRWAHRKRRQDLRAHGERVIAKLT